jgi:glutaminyl-peptide cyclotransferase
MANAGATVSHPPDVVHFDYQILAQRSHKPSLFTQGLVLDGNTFYESSGLYGQSMLVSYPREESANKWAQLTANFTQKDTLPDRYFAEGLALLDDKLYLLTWQEGTVFVYDRNTFAVLDRWRYSGEGWGLTHNGEQLIRSDGSEHLHFHSPEDFSLEKTLDVQESGRPVQRLNELEFIAGYVWANIWHENRLVQIDPATGRVVGSLDLTALTAQVDIDSSESVLNGIAYDAERDGMWVTGKKWPSMYLIKLTRPAEESSE